MPQWTDEPPKDQRGFALRILRTPPTKAIVALVTSTDVLGCITHYARNRTLPCEGEDVCQLCQEGHSYRWHGYIGAIMVDTLEHFLFEFTATASDTFRQYQRLHDTMRGCHFKASRPSQRNNGRVVIQCKPGDEQRLRLPNPPDLKKVLCHIWNVQNTLATEVYTPDRNGNNLQIRKPNGRPDPRPAA